MTFLHQPRDFSQKSFGSLPLVLNWPGLCHMSIPKPISGKRKACRVIGFTPEVVAGSAFPGECWGGEPNQNRGSLCKSEGGNCLCLLFWPPLGGYKWTRWHPCDSVHHDCGHECCPLSLVLLMGMEPSSKTLLLFTKNQDIFCHEGSSPGHLVFHLPSSWPQFMKYSLLLTQGGQWHLCREWLLVQHVWRTSKSHISEHNNALPLSSDTATSTISLDVHHLSLTHSLQMSKLWPRVALLAAGGSAQTRGSEPRGLPATPHPGCFCKWSLPFRYPDVFGFNHFQWELSDDYLHSSTSHEAECGVPLNRRVTWFVTLSHGTARGPHTGHVVSRSVLSAGPGTTGLGWAICSHTKVLQRLYFLSSWVWFAWLSDFFALIGPAVTSRGR